MALVHGFLTVKSDEVLERAVASEVGETDDSNLTESWLNQVSVQYPATHIKKTDTVVENPDEQGE